MARTAPANSPAALLKPGRALTLSSVADGAEGFVLGDLARAVAARKDAPAVSLLVVCRDGARMAQLGRTLRFFAPDLVQLQLPAWDCQPYDRVSPHAGIVAERMITLARLARLKGSEKPTVLLTTVNAVVQRVPAKRPIAGQALSAAPGNRIAMDGITRWLELNGYLRTATVREPGEYAVRGGIIDLYPAGRDEPVRFDFFGDTLESIRTFDPETQRTQDQLHALDLVPVAEFQLITETIRKFRQAYVSTFGTAGSDDQLYEAVSEGRRYPGMEHWLPLFHDRMDTLFDYVPDTPVVLEPLAEEAAHERLAQIADYYEARKQAVTMDGGGPPYKPLPPDRLYLGEPEWRDKLADAALVRVTHFASPEGAGQQGTVVDIGTRAGHNFADERAKPDGNVFEALKQHVEKLQGAGKRVVIALWSEGARDRTGNVLTDHKLVNLRHVSSWPEVKSRPAVEVWLAVFGIEAGFETDELAVIGEQDILGDRLVRQRRASKKAENFIAEVTSLSAGDLVVHVDHGIGRFVGLKTIQAAGAPHDCLELHYAGQDKLYLPVENIELLSRYGSEDTAVELDRLGGAGWQTRKARMKQRIREIAGELIRIAAERQLHEAPRLTLGQGVYDEFCAGFPWDETEDQNNAINAVLDDLSAGRPMDRLVCGDVGFGKTEVALRAALATVMNGKQVAVVVPTTLLARQHFRTFSSRFHGFPVNVAQLSRLASPKETTAAKKGLLEGQVDIVVGTHALLGKGIKFKDLGLVIVDEEQHFGVAHKERLKKLRSEVHVLTLTATPIPRTLQLALTGVRELSIIATPPVDRLAVRTFVTPFDPLTVREALLRERYRGGQAFYVCPRIEDLAEAKAFLDKHVPEVRVVTAHGQMSPAVLEDVMSAFYDGKYDVLLSTTIVESGLDIPTANTLIVHRADMFGLAQLYQLRGRVGRSKTRAYALFTIPAGRKITPTAERRLKVLQSLDTLGAGFQLASHDLDIRGAGNLLGDEQSGHIKEVGFELYQQMLEEAVESLKAGVAAPVEDRWSPQITIGMPVLIPEDYVPDLSVRLALYRRLADLDDEREIDGFAAELVDRFGKMPVEVDYLLKTVLLKALCRRANVAKIDAGPKGAVIAFRDDSFADPAGLVHYIRKQGVMAKVRPDMKVVFFEDWEEPVDRLKGSTAILRDLAAIATKKAA
ncbi:transcription-repair coupling factor [Rhodoplanes elegans]|uniref:Transcription-repair-coupling factor n=1 Tax=Rhodoplanes elegans TaxID=29408 RepID=A0A327K2G5_9BRAD|nr:transcription-repair coupling factor [Rhodoplanes elegans]MBK5961148.1 transcription-repair coupling factor [Rhodoplanes elegans]RAI31976.1 transcription-repair coupling factor [Rhodoplanes elegans]